MSASKPQDILALSDEDFAKLNSPDAVSASGSTDESAEEEETPKEGAEASSEDSSEKDATEGSEASEEKETEDTEGADGAEGDKEPEAKEDESKADADSKAASEKKEPKEEGESSDKTEDSSSTAVTQDVMSDFYKKVVLTPFKANGKQIEIRTPEEAIALMQQGANYTRKMQELAPHRKILTMLSKNGLVDEEKLSFLIDIANKNPDAIKKLVLDAKIDPMDIGEDAAKDYKPGNHRVSDTEVTFRSVMDELKSSESGQKTLSEIHTNWDDASKDLLWTHPDILSDIHVHRENGLYAKITEELSRQKTLGLIAPETSFLLAYKKVGDQLVANEGQGTKAPETSKANTTEANPKAKTPVAVSRPASSKPVVKNSDKAAAASSTRSASKTAPKPVNPLAIPDDEFLKQFANRL